LVRGSVAKAIGFPDRVDWRKCAVQQEEEEQLTEKFKEEFKPFDFTS
jgi:hypothetical protein